MDIDEEELSNAIPSQPEAGPSEPSSVGTTGGLSKSAQKRLAKKAQRDALKPARRAAEKQRRRDRAAHLTQANAAGTLTPSEREAWERLRALRKKKVTVRKGGPQDAEVWKGAVVVDLGFDELMNDQEITSMASQLSHLYATNRVAQHPFATILHTSFGPQVSPRLWDRMRKSNWEKWGRTFWWISSVGDLSKRLLSGVGSGDVEGEAGAGQEGGGEAGLAATASTTAITAANAETKAEGETAASSADLEQYLSDQVFPPGLTSSHKLVYLSADAEDELDTLAEDEVYVIGGIVDRNRHKYLCQRKAEELGIRTARLPIGTFIENLPTRKVLTVNQVFEILSKYLELKDWKEAFEAVIPLRKFHVQSKAEKRKAKLEKQGGGTAEGEDEAERDDGDEDVDEDEEGGEGDAGEEGGGEGGDGPAEGALESTERDTGEEELVARSW